MHGERAVRGANKLQVLIASFFSVTANDLRFVALTADQARL
jgi:hypothetical protein